MKFWKDKDNFYPWETSALLEKHNRENKKLEHCYEGSHFLVAHFSAANVDAKFAGWPFCPKQLRMPNTGQNGHLSSLPPIVVVEKCVNKKCEAS